METFVFRASSNIERASYDEDARELTVKFTHGGSYTVPNVPPQKWRSFKSAPSAGAYFNAHFRSGR